MPEQTKPKERIRGLESYYVYSEEWSRTLGYITYKVYVNKYPESIGVICAAYGLKLAVNATKIALSSGALSEMSYMVKHMMSLAEGAVDGVLQEEVEKILRTP